MMEVEVERKATALREIKCELNLLSRPDGSVLLSQGIPIQIYIIYLCYLCH